ncbi:hypothetical protein BDF20DRAFT_883883 [Mycotypha africana]|uniref:uncharacterized protein n=1 Tax=Mycotypha africana TaxID=64632 RepID=UPI0023012A18|nr:uncharacterized protein BDF20DRAFT_883883 [Mycotypha africana]KAI8973742.1 hypothetical protein BDF20DRAFT_883883 [Mycotypha africana]
MVICQICNVNESKYKCPQCKLQYCSLVCYKKHKETPCGTTTNNEDNDNSGQDFIRKPIKPVGHPDEEDPSRLTPEDLQKLAYSDKVHQFLKDTQIREIIQHIDSSKTPEKDIDSIRNEYPNFDEFLNHIVDLTYKPKLEAFLKKKEKINNNDKQE